VVDVTADPARGNGFAFTEASADALVDAVGRAALAREDADEWAALQRRGMAIDWSWESGPAPRYADMYRRAIALRRGL
jgi:starch synthase